MENPMRPNDLEKSAVEKVLADTSVKPTKKSIRWDAISIKSRSLTGAGFLTEFEPSPELKVFADGVSLRWGKVGARLNVRRTETGYLVYVDGGQITAVEGYTYGDEWPNEVDSIEWYELKEGSELENPPKLDLA
ncbi:MAG: hypothetical protein ABI560_13300 [Myxococcales bacterium]